MFYSPFIHSLRKSLALTTAVGLCLFSSYLLFEPTLTEAAATDSVVVTQVVTGSISINAASDVTMSRSLGASADNAIGSTTWTVTTNNNSGYNLKVHAAGTPALQDTANSNSFADYSGTATTPTTWSVTSGVYAFGFSAYGGGTETSKWGTGSSCGSSNTPASTLKYAGFDGTTDIQVANTTGPTAVDGDDTTLCFATEQNGVLAPAGTYKATITATATTI